MEQLTMFEGDPKDFEATNPAHVWARQQQIYQQIRNQEASMKREVARARADIAARSARARLNPR